ncbi:hypothetical protein [Paenibacillus sp. MMS20-IR301]|uniref:hypothetical protein n=1 Tax=Paenibacillus sp. MMS20-IR301 TaxID=2895946 RepID=UPI0028F117A1|nr:hypothetical protein [Paenibacillus sp. MMS20-IR301]WNS41733.1 hypothetical protein LOS79_22305 [Paenibacillus sp. MMS20-IR301]
MSLRFDFDASAWADSSFQTKKMDEDDLSLLQKYNVKTWDDKAFTDESILKWGYWTINDNRDRILKAIGGGSFEIPEMYTFIYNELKIKLECGGSGEPANTYKRHEDHSYDQQINISRLIVPQELSASIDDIAASIAEALAVASFKSANLNKISVVFPKR